VDPGPLTQGQVIRLGELLRAIDEKQQARQIRRDEVKAIVRRKKELEYFISQDDGAIVEIKRRISNPHLL
jgi:hypothetical protein